MSSFVAKDPGEELRAADFRRRLKAAARYRQVSVLSSVVTVQELMGLAEHDWSRYSSIVRLLFHFARNNFLEDTRELWIKEYMLGRAVRGRERLADSNLLDDLRRQSLRREVAADVMKDVRAFQRRFVRDEEARRQRIQETFARHVRAGEDPAHAVRVWWRSAEEHITDWARTTLTTMLDMREVKHADLSNYPVRALPTLWNFHAYKLARIEMNVGEHRRIAASDPADAHHYTLAAYASIFVSDDRALRETCRAIPHASVRPLTLSEFAKSHLPFVI